MFFIALATVFKSEKCIDFYRKTNEKGSRAGTGHILSVQNILTNSFLAFGCSLFMNRTLRSSTELFAQRWCSKMIVIQYKRNQRQVFPYTMFSNRTGNDLLRQTARKMNIFKR